MSSIGKGLEVYIAIALLLFSAIFALSIVLPVVAVSSNTVGCGSTITTSTTLTANIGPCSGDGLIIGASGIVLNCAGHTISGMGSGSGISSLQEATKVTVENCNVTGFEYGFFIAPFSYGNTLTKNTATGNTGYGFYLKRSSLNNLNGNTAYGNGNGFFLFRSQRNSFNGNTADGNGNGFFLSYGSIQNTFSGNTANSNSHFGYYDLIGRSTEHRYWTGNKCSGNFLGGSFPTGLCKPQS